jgi:hypothetical protein
LRHYSDQQEALNLISMLKPSPTYRGNLETVMTQLDHDWDLHLMVAERHEVGEHVIGFVSELHRVLWQSKRREGNELGEFGR